MKKFLSLLVASSFAFYMQACSDNSTSADDDEIEKVSSSSSADKAKSSSSKVKSSSSSVKSSSSKAKSSSSKKVESSSSSEDSYSVYVIGNDYASGDLRWVDDKGKISKKSILFGGDSKLCTIDGNIYVLERTGSDDLVLLNSSREKVWTVKFDADANPYDVVKANKDEVWVALRGVPKLVKVSVKKGKITKTVKTDAFANGNNPSPELVDLEVSGDTLFALFQRSTGGWDATYPAGLLAMYKLDNGDLLDTIRLAKGNPYGMAFAKGKLYVGSTGGWNALGTGMDADEARGIEVVNIAKKKSSMVVDGTKLGGGVWGFAVDAKNAIAYVAVMASWGVDEPLVEVNLEKKTVNTISGVSSVGGTIFYDDVSETLFLGSGATNSYYTYSAGTLTEIKKATDDILPPYGIVVVR